jgi:hypothetical protein
VGIYLPEKVFTHGQLYVALSRARRRENIRIFAADRKLFNSVYKEVLDDQYTPRVEAADDLDGLPDPLEAVEDIDEAPGPMESPLPVSTHKGKGRARDSVHQEEVIQVSDEQYRQLFTLFYPNGGPSEATFSREQYQMYY